MTDDRSERLRRRRKNSTAQATERNSVEDDIPSKPSESDERSEGSNPSKNADPATDGADRENISIKEEQIGTYMYLPESQTKELRRQYNILKAEYEFEYDEEFEKNRHFYPLIVQYGLDGLEEMDASEIRTRLEEIVN